MRICYIANADSSHTVKWAKHFIELGHEVHIISHGKGEVPGAQVYYVNYSLKNFMAKSREVHRLIKEINPDILHAQTANTCGLYGVTTRGYKVIVSTWGSDILVSPQRSIILKKIIEYVLKKAYLITSDSQYMSEKIIELGGSKDKIYTFPMGVEDHLTHYRHSYDFDRPEFNIVSLRRLEEMYNIDLLIKGFAKALKENNNLHLTIAADGSEMNKLKALVVELGISNHVTFLGRYSPEDVGKILADQDIFVSIPDSDATSVSLLESMCCGVFPVVCDLPANREWIRQKENGIILRELTEDAIKDTLLWCYANREFLAKASSQNIELIAKTALWSKNVKIVEDLYERILKEGN